MICTSAFLVFFTSCEKEEESSPTGNIQGVVVEKYTGNPVPFARLIVYTSIPINLFNSSDSIIDTLKADAAGKFELSRQKYKDLYDKTGHSSIYICGDGPLIDNNSFYYSNCSEWGTSFSWQTREKIKCELNSKSWIKFTPIDDPQINISTNKIIVQNPTVGAPNIGILQENFGIPSEPMQVIGDYQLTLYVQLNTLGDGISGNNNLQIIETISHAKDTTEIVISF